MSIQQPVHNLPFIFSRSERLRTAQERVNAAGQAVGEARDDHGVVKELLRAQRLGVASLVAMQARYEVRT